MTFKSWITKHGITAAAVARGTGIPHNTLSRFLTGESALSPAHIATLAHFSGGAVSFLDLIREGERRRKAKRAKAAKAHAAKVVCP